MLADVAGSIVSHERFLEVRLRRQRVAADLIQPPTAPSNPPGDRPPVATERETASADTHLDKRAVAVAPIRTRT